MDQWWSKKTIYIKQKTKKIVYMQKPLFIDLKGGLSYKCVYVYAYIRSFVFIILFTGFYYWLFLSLPISVRPLTKLLKNIVLSYENSIENQPQCVLDWISKQSRCTLYPYVHILNTFSEWNELSFVMYSLLKEMQYYLLFKELPDVKYFSKNQQEITSFTQAVTCSFLYQTHTHTHHLCRFFYLMA